MTKNSFPERFGLRLRAIRLNTGLTQSELARRIGRSKQLVSAWENGRAAMLVRDLARVAGVLGCTADDLLWPGDPQRHPEPIRTDRDFTPVESTSPSPVGSSRSESNPNGQGE
jgi:transcriptional regulator with XRE-family HTH domain